MKTKKLTPRQHRFVQEYLVDLNATQACIRAGYSAKNADKIGCELLGKTRVLSAVREAQAKRAAETGRTAMEVVRDIQAVTSEARQNGDLKTALRGLELEGKHLGLFSDVNLNMSEPPRLELILAGLPDPKGKGQG